MARLSDSLSVRGTRIKNRIAMLPMVTFSFRGDGDDYYGGRHIAHYTEAARGEAGLIIMQATNVLGASDFQGMWTPGSMDALRTIAANARQYGATVMMQLACGDSDINSLSTEEIEARQVELAAAAIKAYELGFHGVEYHCAHGFALCRFLDAEYNRRTDKFGGSVQNRARIVTEILADVRQKTSADFILSVRMGEFQPKSADGLDMARHFEASGIDMFDISFGMKLPEAPAPADFPFSRVTCSAYAVKQAVSIPVIGLYEIRTGEQARMLIENGYADIAGIGRAMLADPHFAAHILNGEPVNSCQACKRCKWFTDHAKCPARIMNAKHD